MTRSYQTFWPRFWAGIIDSLVIGAIALGVYFPLSLLLNVTFLAAGADEKAVALLRALLSMSLPILYSVSLHAKFGQTFGKMAQDI
jgi:uncharacterized RDD family membrane protein YckC